MRTWTRGVLLAWALWGCSNPEDPRVIYAEYFEHLCDEMPCGWTQRGGPEGAARFVHTAAGARGLEFMGDGVLVHAEPMGMPTGSRQVISNVMARLIARCDSDSGLELRLNLELLDGNIITLSREFAPDDRWSEGPNDELLEPREESSSSVWEFERVLALQLLKRGPGACELSGMIIRAFP